jgi:hypothetical protein
MYFLTSSYSRALQLIQLDESVRWLLPHQKFFGRFEAKIDAPASTWT